MKDFQLSCNVIRFGMIIRASVWRSGWHGSDEGEKCGYLVLNMGAAGHMYEM